MNVGDVISVTGCVTKEKFIIGRTLVEIEKILGFHAGRLSGGVAMVALSELPGIDQFELAAYSNVATHRFKAPDGFNLAKIKADAKLSWAITGPERLVKALPTVRHNGTMDPDIQYPPGQGAPQWLVKIPLKAKVVALVTDYPNGRYRAADVVRF